MTFPIGSSVRINSGQHYGKVARLISCEPDGTFLVELFYGAGAFRVASVLDTISNNGD